LTVEEAEDATQDTLVAVARHIGEFRYEPARCSFKGWLLLIARQRIIWRWRQRQPVATAPATGTADDTTRTASIDRLPDPASLDLDAVWEKEWRDRVLELALTRVKPKVKARQFQIFDLCALQHWSAGQVARSLGVSAAQVYLAKHRVGSVLKREVRKVERELAEVS
jgi:RNA polymerase sigma-70 factor (ECF subfamily)